MRARRSTSSQEVRSASAAPSREPRMPRSIVSSSTRDSESSSVAAGAVAGGDTTGAGRGVQRPAAEGVPAAAGELCPPGTAAPVEEAWSMRRGNLSASRRCQSSRWRARACTRSRRSSMTAREDAGASTWRCAESVSICITAGSLRSTCSAHCRRTWRAYSWGATLVAMEPDCQGAQGRCKALARHRTGRAAPADTPCPLRRPRRRSGRSGRRARGRT